nr:uncharacterized protein LOC107281457 [Oryza sativa Japonica Group]
MWIFNLENKSFQLISPRLIHCTIGTCAHSMNWYQELDKILSLATIILSGFGERCGDESDGKGDESGDDLGGVCSRALDGKVRWRLGMTSALSGGSAGLRRMWKTSAPSGSALDCSGGGWGRPRLRRSQRWTAVPAAVEGHH